jgi:hypothetical protein
MAHQQIQQSSHKRTLAVENPSGIQILQWLSHIAGYRIFKMSAAKHGRQSTAKVVSISVHDWNDIYTAAQFSNSLALFLPVRESVALLEGQIGQHMDVVVPLDTGLPAVGRKAVFFRMATTLVLAFEATKPNEMIMNAWSHGKDKKWSLPYARFIDGRQVHSFYLDMWLGLRRETLKALTASIQDLERQGQAPSSFIVSGHSMGGGISTQVLFTEL